MQGIGSKGPLALLPTPRRGSVSPALAPSPCASGSPTGQPQLPWVTAAPHLVLLPTWKGTLVPVGWLCPHSHGRREQVTPRLYHFKTGVPQSPLPCWLRLWFSLLLGGRRWDGATGSLGQALHGPVPGLGSRPWPPVAVSGPCSGCGLHRRWLSRLQRLHWLRGAATTMAPSGPVSSRGNYCPSAPFTADGLEEVVPMLSTVGAASHLTCLCCYFLGGRDG